MLVSGPSCTKPLEGRLFVLPGFAVRSGRQALRPAARQPLAVRRVRDITQKGPALADLKNKIVTGGGSRIGNAAALAMAKAAMRLHGHLPNQFQLIQSASHTWNVQVAPPGTYRVEIRPDGRKQWRSLTEKCEVKAGRVTNLHYTGT